MALLSKVKIGEQIYDIKDKFARDEIAKLGTAALKDVAATISDGEGKIADAATVKAYVDAQVGAIHNFSYEIVANLPTASAETMYKIYLKSLGTAAAPDAYEEFITIDNGEGKDPRYVMEKIGDTNIDLNGYVPTSRTIAGLALSANITADALKTALGLGAMAYAATASGSVAGQTISGVKATGTTTGALTGAIGYDSTAVASTGKFKPAGTVSGNVTAAGSVTMEAAADGEGIQVSGTVAAPTVTVQLAKADEVLGSIKDAAVAPTFQEGAFTAATLTHSEDTFAKAGVVAAMDETDTEMLVFTAAATGTASNITGFTGGSKAADTFTAGSAMTFNTKNVVSGVESASATAPAFTGGRIKASFAGTETAIDAEFAGSEGDINVSGNYDKANLGTVAFQGAAVELAVGDITVAAKDVTVTPDAE